VINDHKLVITFSCS